MLKGNAKSQYKSKGIFSCGFGCSLRVCTCYFLETFSYMSYIGGQTKRNTQYTQILEAKKILKTAQKKKKKKSQMNYDHFNYINNNNK